MAAINFTMFIDKVEDGTKTQTIRKETNVKAGDTLQLYTGQRTKACRKLKDAICKSVTPIILMERIAIQTRNNVMLTGIYLEDFAIKDGFTNYSQMWNFFKKWANAEGEFQGKVIKW